LFILLEFMAFAEYAPLRWCRVYGVIGARGDDLSPHFESTVIAHLPCTDCATKAVKTAMRSSGNDASNA